MTGTKALAAMLGLIVALVAVSGCGDDDSSSGGAYGGRGGTTSESTTTQQGASGTVATVSVASASKLGRVIVDSHGFTLYDFHKDRGTSSACYGACSGVWPPLITTGAPKASGGALAAKLGTTKRKDGSVQVTYAGHPLYTYASDTRPGDAKGNDIDSFGAEWYALQPSGEEPEG